MRSEHVNLTNYSELKAGLLFWKVHIYPAWPVFRGNSSLGLSTKILVCSPMSFLLMGTKFLVFSAWKNCKKLQSAFQGLFALSENLANVYKGKLAMYFPIKVLLSFLTLNNDPLYIYYQCLTLKSGLGNVPKERADAPTSLWFSFPISLATKVFIALVVF